MIGDLLHGLDLHGNMKPVDDVVVGLGTARAAALGFGAVRDHRHIPKAAISFLERVKSMIADCLLVGAAGNEIATAPFAPSPGPHLATTSSKFRAEC
ncbi:MULTISPECIES: hypothetical protein [unclassified Mesorhizobium]|uniref:hypothetical protein n=1 Tax=unclassified Mesorhizobium TaxID=325217 RepID=UPI0012EB2E21|nr:MULTISPECIES: hypothetical protein [unclassified Mesorhizobium]WJI74718.1 hypothetical protein NLY37_27750 [Mesorhizobium sp. C395A]